MDKTIEKIVSLCKRRGFVFQSSDIYGGFSAVYDYGPLGIELKNNISQIWWKEMTQIHENIVGLDSGILMHPKIWEASGHTGAFNDPLVDCKQCKARFRADMFSEEFKNINWKETQCLKCGTIGMLTEPRQFNLMFKTSIGPLEEKGMDVFLRPETAQGIYVNYQLVQSAMRTKVPFGIAQIGKAFRNEIIARNFIFRTREFEQMEIEYFCKKENENEWFDFWVNKRLEWYKGIGIPEEKLRLREHEENELAHYASKTVDIEFDYPWGWGELEGIANRGSFDLSSHESSSGKDLSYFDSETNEKIAPVVIEPAGGLTRTLFALLCSTYDEEVINDTTRTLFRFNFEIAPVQIGILPLSKKEELIKVSNEIQQTLQKFFRTEVDVTQSIGKRYRRQDEIGTPYCVTIDFDSLEDLSVTIRNRDSMDQERIKIEDLLDYFSKI